MTQNLTSYPSLLQRGLVYPAAALAVILTTAVAVFNEGGYFIGTMSLCAVSVWFILGAIGYVERERLWPLSRTEYLALASLAALWLWSGASVLWSIAPDMSWTEFNRCGAYFAVFTVGLFLARHRSATISSVCFFVALAVSAAIYCLGVKVAPGLIENAGNLGRISVPLGYPNAVGLLMALPVPLAIYLSASASFAWPLRLLGTLTAPLLLLALFFTLSRGAMVALIIGLIVYFAVTPLRLRSFFALLLASLAAFPVATWSSGQDDLMQDEVDLVLRQAAAQNLLVYIVAALVAAGLLFALALFLGGRVELSPVIGKIAGVAILTVILVSLLTGAFAFVMSKPDFSQWASDSYHTITRSTPEETGAGRLFEFGLSSRYLLWEEAVANWQKDPVLGTGGQSFPLVHLQLRQRGNLFVKQPHGLPFRLLTELGAVGLVLGAGFFGITQAGGTLNVYRRRDRWEMGLLASLLSMNVVYLVHTSFDWDWNMMALTLIYFFFSGMLLGSSRIPGMDSKNIKGGDGG